MILIGLSGKKQSGKDTFCGFLREAAKNHGVSTERIAFADSLKEELAAACHVTPDFIECHKDQFRLGLQWWGTEFRRQICGYDGYWIDKLNKKLILSTADVVIIPDVRFVNEARFVLRHGGRVIRIVRAGADRNAESTHQHVSETDMDGFTCDYQVRASTIPGLRKIASIVALDHIIDPKKNRA